MPNRLWQAVAFLMVLLLALPVASMQADQNPVSTGEGPTFTGVEVEDLGLFGGDSGVRTGVRVIVELADPPLAAYGGSLAGLPAPARLPDGKISIQSAEAQRYLDYLAKQQLAFRAALARALPEAGVAQYLDEQGRARDLSYRFAFNGMTIHLPQADRESLIRLARLPGVKAIYPVVAYEITMDASLPLLGLVDDANDNGLDPSDADAGLWDAVGGHANAGAGLKVALLDTGVAQDHPFFDPTGYTYPAGFPKGDTRYTTPKVIVARGYYRPDDPPQNPGPYDYNGHGSHTGGTIAGNYGTVATVGTYTQTVSGVAPRAYLMNYQLFYLAESGSESAYNAEILKAFDDLIADGADVTSNSWSGPDNLLPAADPLMQAVANIAAAGIVPVFAAGNSGPGQSSAHPPSWAPEAISVGASTTSRLFGNDLDVTAPATVPVTLTNIIAVPAAFGPTITQTVGPAVYTYVGDACSAISTDLTGKIALIIRGGCYFTTKVQNAQDAGAIAAVVYNNRTNAPPITMGGTSTTIKIPAVMVGNKQGGDLKSWEATNSGTAQLQISADTTRNGHDHPADIIADFSGRGPGLGSLTIKPDVVAPGVDILSAYYNSETGKVDGWGAIQGTSMATPHVAGAAVLLKQLHPSWSPAQIKSALMSTATGVEGTLYNDYAQTGVAGVMDRGAGRIDLSKAGDPGLTFDRPSVSFGQMMPGQTASVTIEATDVVSHTGTFTYTITISETGDVTTTAYFTAGTSVTQLGFTGAGDTATFNVTMEIAPNAPAGDYEGLVWLRHGPHSAHIPFWVRVKPTATVKDILLVDDSLSSLGVGTSYLSYYTSTLESLGYTYDVLDTGYIYAGLVSFPSLAELQAYKAIVWFTGDSYYTYYHLGVDVASGHRMIDYLRSGGRLLMTGQDFSGYDLGSTYGKPYLVTIGAGAEEIVEDQFDPSTAPFPVVEGMPSVAAFQGMLLDLGPSGDGANNQEYVDEVTAYGGDYGSEVFLRSLMPGATKGGGVGLLRHLEYTLESPNTLSGPDYRAVYLAFGLEGINNTSGYTSRKDFMKALLNFLLDEVSVTLTGAGAPNDVATLKAEVTSSVGATGVRYRWDFGDGSPIVETTTAEVTHVYTSTGTYTARVEVTDSYGHTAIGSAPVLVTAAGSTTKSVDKSLAYVGDELTYTIVLKNTSLVTTTVALTDTLPTYTDYVSHTVGTIAPPSSGTGTWSAPELRWSGSLAPGAVVTLTLTVKITGNAPVGGKIVNTALVGTPDGVFTKSAETTVGARVFLPLVMRNYP